MTYADIVARFLSETTDQPLEQCAALVAAYRTCFPTVRFDQEVSRRQATRLRSQLRKELSRVSPPAHHWASTSYQPG
jgi:hypothetical protein